MGILTATVYRHSVACSARTSRVLGRAAEKRSGSPRVHLVVRPQPERPPTRGSALATRCGRNAGGYRSDLRRRRHDNRAAALSLSTAQIDLGVVILVIGVISPLRTCKHIGVISPLIGHFIRGDFPPDIRGDFPPTLGVISPLGFCFSGASTWRDTRPSSA